MHTHDPEVAFILALPCLFFLAILLTCGELFLRFPRRRHRMGNRQPLLGDQRGRHYGAMQNSSREHRSAPANTTPRDLESGLMVSDDPFIGWSGVQNAAVTASQWGGIRGKSSEPNAGELPGSDEMTRIFATDSRSPHLTEASSRTSVSPATSPSWRLSLELVHTFAQTGQGAATVRKDKATGELVVIKAIKAKQGARKLPKEVRILAMLADLGDHDNIVRAFEWHYTDQGTCDVVMQYCDGGDLFDFNRHWARLRRSNPTTRDLPKMFYMHFIVSMADALNFLHGHGLVHRDIKPDNVLLRRPSSSSRYGLPDFVLGDFGLLSPQRETRGQEIGTIGYYPPELMNVASLAESSPELYAAAIDKFEYSPATDVYCFGATLYALLFGGFNNKRQDYTQADIKLRLSGSRFDSWINVKEVLLGALQLQPENRLTTERLAQIATAMRREIVEEYCAGERMPENACPAIEFNGDGRDLPEVPVAERSITGGIVQEYTWQKYSPLNDGKNMSAISGFGNDWCTCDNHRKAYSMWQVKPGCPRYDTADAGAFEFLTAKAAVVQSAFSDDSEEVYMDETFRPVVLPVRG